ncbi:MAG: hypothetical protein ACJAWX_002055 [Algoriphagus sp.]
MGLPAKKPKKKRSLASLRIIRKLKSSYLAKG